jgi:hypothetical protein
MKKLILSTMAIAITSAALITPSTANASNIAQNLCEYIAADDKKRLRSFLKQNKLKIRSIFKGVQCNGQNILEFAATKGSLKSGSLIISKLPKKDVSKNMEFLTSKSPELLEEAKKRVG